MLRVLPGSLYALLLSQTIVNQQMGKVFVNGEEQQVPLPISLLELITRNEVSQPEMVSVQLNGAFVVREQYADTTLSEGDEVDFLYFMGGGAG
jgi:sulfur carrier protein